MYATTRDRPTSTQLILLLAITAAIACLLVSPSSAQRHPRSHLQVAHPNPPATAAGNLVTHDLATGGETPESLVQALVGPGAIVSNVHYTGAPIAAGTFSGGAGIIGFENGVILSSGDIVKVVSPINTSSDEEPTQNNTPGDPDLDAILGVEHCCSFDAAVLEFDLECPTATAASFQFVFASEEYDPPPGPIDDLFACVVNGQNVALLPGTNAPVSLQTLNCGIWPSGPNCAFFVTNDCGRLGLGFPCSHIPTEMDGLTVVLSATAALHPGANHVKLAIADSYDDVVDSDVFLRGLSFVCSPGVPVFEASSLCEIDLSGWAGVPFDLDVGAWATNNMPGASITLDATGDPIPLAAGTFLPPLPTSPAQPGTTHFQWTPTAADIGLHHLVFTATDQVQASTSLDVTLQVRIPGPPVFMAPSPCNQILDAVAGALFSFPMTAAAWTSAECGVNGAPGQSVTLSVTGDAIPLGGGIFDPSLPAGPAQPVSTQFRWTPTPSDVGLYHLEFTATDQAQQSASCGVTIRVSLPPPVFQAPATCGQVVEATVERLFAVSIAASARNGDPGQSVILSVTGDATPLAGGTFDPPLPAGPAQPVSTLFQWTPTLADLGSYHLEFTATDQLQQSASCGLTIRVLSRPATDLCQAGTGTVRGCPCSNPPATSPSGCDNSAETGGARLESNGSPEIAHSTVVFTTTGEKPSALSVVVQGDTLLSGGVIYGQGVRCVGGRLKRLYTKTAFGGSITAPGSADPSIPARSAWLGDSLVGGSTRYYSVYYRDPIVLGGCPAGSRFNATQTQEIHWAP